MAFPDSQTSAAHGSLSHGLSDARHSDRATHERSPLFQHTPDVNEGPPQHLVTVEHPGNLPGNNVRAYEMPAPTSLKSALVPQKRTCLRAWMLEAFSLLLAIGCLVSIIKLLIDANGKPQQDWRAWIGFNTLVAVLSTVFRSAIAHIASQVISQLKWSWLRRPFPLVDLQHFDDASRGIWGASMLAYRLRRISFVQIGCLVTIASVAVGTFCQQAIRNELCLQPFGEVRSSLPLAQGFLLGSTSYARVGPGLYVPNLAIRASLINAIADPAINRSTLLRDCPTGNCTFTANGGFSHETMGFCSLCEDTTNQVSAETAKQEQSAAGSAGNTTFDTVTSQLSLPNGQNLTNSSIAVLETTVGSTAFQNMTLESPMSTLHNISMANISMLALTSASCKYTSGGTKAYWNCSASIDTDPSSHWDQISTISAACSIYPCMRQYKASVRNGVLTETLVKSRPALSGLGQLPSLYGVNEPCVLPSTLQDVSTATGPIIDESNPSVNTVLLSQAAENETLTAIFNGQRTPIPNSCINYMASAYQLAMEQLLQAALSGTCQLSESRLGLFSTSPEIRSGIVCYDSASAAALSSAYANAGSGGWWLQSLYNNGNATFASINNNMQVIADALTDRLRSDSFNASDARTFVQGTVLQTMVCTRMAWEWLILPAVLLLLTTIFLISTIVRSLIERDNIPLWKSSVLALIYSPSDDVRTSASSTVTAMEDEARATDVQIRNIMANGSWQLERRASYASS